MKHIAILIHAKIDEQEFPESKLGGTLKNILEDHAREFSVNILGDNESTITVSIND